MIEHTPVSTKHPKHAKASSAKSSKSTKAQSTKKRKNESNVDELFFSTTEDKGCITRLIDLVKDLSGRVSEKEKIVEDLLSNIDTLQSHVGTLSSTVAELSKFTK